MQNIPEDDMDESVANKVPTSKPAKSMNKIINNRYLNQNIYSMFLQKRYEQCLNLLDKCKPDEFKIYMRSLIQKNDYRLQKSVELLSQCLVMNKLNFSYLKAISKNFYLLGKYKSSLQVAKDAFKINSNDCQIYYILGKVSLALGDKSQAITHFKYSISKEPNEWSYIQQAKIYMDSSEYIQAADVLKECAIISPQNPEAFEMLGVCFSKIGKSDQALVYYEQALQADAMRYNSLIGLGAIKLDKGQTDAALDIFTKAYKTSSNSAILWNNIGVNMQMKNKLVSAYCCFKRALFLDPFRWDIHANIALIFIMKKKYLPAQIHLRSALKLNKDATLYNLLGMCLCELKDFVSAQKSYEQGLKMQINNEEIKYNLMLCVIKKGDKSKAKEMFNQLIRSCNNSHIRDRLQEARNLLQDRQ